MRSTSLGVFICLCLVHYVRAHAQERPSVAKHSVDELSLIAPLEQSKAQAWNLKAEEWRRYRHLMEGPLGTYSPGIDPLTALGIEARNSEEQKRYTEMQAHAEYSRVTKLLAYQNAYNEAFTRLYPDLLTVDLLGSNTTTLASPAATTTRLSVFVSLQCEECIERVQSLQIASHQFDLYVLGAGNNDEVIRGWANSAGIDSQKVRNRDITLNHDAGRWLRIGDKGSFPAVMRQVNGQWQRH